MYIRNYECVNTVIAHIHVYAMYLEFIELLEKTNVLMHDRSVPPPLFPRLSRSIF